MQVNWPRRCIACGTKTEEDSERYSKIYERMWIDREKESDRDGKDVMIERHETIRATLYICDECKKTAEEHVSAVGNKYENREKAMCKVSFGFFLIMLGLLAFQLMFPLLHLFVFGLVAAILLSLTIAMGAIWTKIAKRAEVVKLLRENPPAAFLGIDIDEEGNLSFGFSSHEYAEEFRKENPSLNTKSMANPFSFT